MSRRLEPFLLSRYEVSQAQYARIMGRNPSECAGERITQYPVDDRHPVESMTWEDALLFAERLDLTLPTEAQWEWACRASTRTPWFWGEDAADLEGRANVSDESLVRAIGRVLPSVAWDDGHPAHAPIDAFPPNAWGFHDMHGNVEEWCLDSYHQRLSGVQPSGPDGRAPPREESPEMHTTRGGGWQSTPLRCRSAARNGRDPLRYAPTVGIRVARRTR